MKAEGRILLSRDGRPVVVEPGEDLPALEAGEAERLERLGLIAAAPARKAAPAKARAPRKRSA